MNASSLNAEEIRKYAAIFGPQTFFEQEGYADFKEEAFDPGYVNDNDYHAARGVLVRTCTDGLLAYNNEKNEKGILLITRKGDPAKGQLWPIGGGMPRHVLGPEEALRANAKRETNLELDDLVYLGSVDMGWASRPQETATGGQGIRDYGIMFYANGEGELQLKELDNDPVIVTPDMWEKKAGPLAELHPYVSKNMELAMTLLIDSHYSHR